MALRSRQGKIANRLSKASRPRQARRQQSSTHDADADVTVEWGQQLDPQGNGSASTSSEAQTPTVRRVTRQSGMSNKVFYRSVIVNGSEYCLGQAVQVKSPNDGDPYLAVIYKLWENEQGLRQIVARWLLRRTEMYLGPKIAASLNDEPAEVFYSNADDLITPEMIIGPLQVVSYATFVKTQASSPASPKSPSRRKAASAAAGATVRFCRRYFNEQSAFIGELDWDVFSKDNRLLDPSVDAELFKPKDKRPIGKDAAVKAGRAKAEARRNHSSTSATPRSRSVKSTSTSKAKRQRLDDSAESDDDASDGGSDYEDSKDTDDIYESNIPATPSRPGARRATISRTPARTRQTPSRKTPATATKRRARLRDIQLPAVNAAIQKRASRTAKIAKDTAAGNMSVYEAARSQLHVAAVPDTLPCREDEFAEIYGHLYTAIEERNSMCIYISGVPGTGKTATVHETIRALNENVEEGELPDFQFIELNGMKMTEPNQAYAQLWQAITGNRATAKHAAQLLEKHFSTPSPRRHTYVVLVDELDLLVTKSQSIMYNFFDWPHRPHARLIVIAIANTMDLPERMLYHKVSSRLGLTRINFQPYSHHQLMTIVQSRLEGCIAFDADAIELCARKISAVSGDARRALDVCRRAVEMVEAEWKCAKEAVKPGTKRTQSNTNSQLVLVTMVVIDHAIKSMYASGHIAAIQNASTQQKVFLVALRAAIRKAGIPEVPLGDVAFVHRQLCQMHDLLLPSYEQISKICAQLGASRFILAESSLLDVHQQVRLVIAEDDITVALRPDPLFNKIATS
ncbi:Origin recognition complex, subunit 1 [Coemansia guatemalensis]|uniref:Origin recognition complex subunit 1 n=1 Tax=Coemansia guatemalensis TaxID=2761395 RepID=A0A9W8I3V8_9FUNG|nr:Origin recognition complex, subunit 1 [Coemansia guatemalensis]